MGFVRGEGGGYAERVAVDRRWLLPLPASASFAEGAAFPMAFLTAWIPLTELVRIAFGARVLSPRRQARSEPRRSRSCAR